MTDEMKNACARCGKALAHMATAEQLPSHATWDAVTGAGPFCGAGCMELARRDIPATWAERA